MSWIARVCLMFSILCCAFSDFSVRVRLPTGKIARLSIAKESTLSSLHQTLLHAGFYADNETDAVRIGGRSFSGKMLSAMSETVGSVGLAAGDIIQVSAVTANCVPVVAGTTAHRPTLHAQAALLTSKRRNVGSKGSISDITSRRATLLRAKYQPTKNLTALIDIARVGPVLGEMLNRRANKHLNSVLPQNSRVAVALLLGNAAVFGNGTYSSSCTAAVEVLGPQSSDSITDRDAPGLTSVSRYIIQQTIRLAGFLGLEIVGCALGVLGWPEKLSAVKRGGVAKEDGRTPRRRGDPHGSVVSSRSWTADHVRWALQLHALSAAAAVPAERFVVVSAQPKTSVARGGDGAQESGAELEAYALSNFALELHNRSQMVLAGPVSAPSVLQLKKPVILSDGREVTEVDALLLAVPLPLVEARAGRQGDDVGELLPEGPFPSLLLMQRDMEVAGAAQLYLRRLLDALLEEMWADDRACDGGGGGGGGRSVRLSLFRRLLDPQLMLYLALLLGDGPPSDTERGVSGPSPLAALCGELRPYLRSSSSNERVAVSAQTLAALDAARRALVGT